MAAGRCLIGLTVFSASSFACGVAPTIVWLNFARTLEGLGAAMQLSASLAALSHEFRGPARTRAFAFWGSVIGIAVAAGPIILARHIAAGNLPGMSNADPQAALHALALGSFGSGYEAILVAAAALAGLAALLCWVLVRAADSAPVNRR